MLTKYLPFFLRYSLLAVSLQELVDREELFAALRTAREEIESLNQEVERMEVPPPFRSSVANASKLPLY